MLYWEVVCYHAGFEALFSVLMLLILHYQYYLPFRFTVAEMILE